MDKVTLASRSWQQLAGKSPSKGYSAQTKGRLERKKGASMSLSTIVSQAYTMPTNEPIGQRLYQPTETITPAQALRTLHVPNTHIPGSQHSSNTPNLAENVIKALSIDNLVFGLDDDDLKILLVKQTDPLHQGKWALPGGWIRYDENLRDAAYRLLEELTGVRDLYLEQLKTFGRVDRFPSERVVTIAYYALVSADKFSLVAGQSAADVSWQSVNKLPELVYDHAEIIEHGLKVLRHQVCHQPIGFNLLPEKFTLLQLQALYEVILNTTLDKPNFRRKIMKMNLLSPCNEKQQGVPHRAASLYRFDAEAYKHLSESGFAFEI